MASKTFNLSLPEELVESLDKQAKKDYSSRSDYIRKAIVNQLKAEASISDDAEVIKSAKKLLDKYRQDFENLSQR